MSETTATYRDYGDFRIDTSAEGETEMHDDHAVIAQSWLDEAAGHRVALTCELTREQARHLGIRLIAWTGEDWAFSLHAEHTFDGAFNPLHVVVTDGEPILRVGNGPEVEVGAEVTHDMGVRLIAWAGAEVPDGSAPVELDLPWDAYTHKRFDAIYERHAEQLGRRPKFTVLRGDGAARVKTIRADAATVRAIIAEVVGAVTADV